LQIEELAHSDNQRKPLIGLAGNDEAGIRGRTSLTLAQQLVAYGQHLHERPQLLVFGEQLRQVLAARNRRQTDESSSSVKAIVAVSWIIDETRQEKEREGRGRRRGAKKQSW
jgi:hypothetical protein